MAQGNGVSSTQGMSRKVSLESGLGKGVAFSRASWGGNEREGAVAGDGTAGVQPIHVHGSPYEICVAGRVSK